MSVARVVVVVFDGLRPDMIAGRMPRLEAFAAGEAVTFTQASSVFPTMTRVATSTTATGCWPRRHGLVANTFHLPALRRGAALDSSAPGDLDALAAHAGALLGEVGLGARLAASGKRMAAIHCGTAGAARLLNDAAGRDGAWTFSVHGRDRTLSPGAVDRAVAAVGPLPDMAIPKVAATAYAAAVAETLALVADGPEVTVIWLPEPDTSYHYREIGSAEANRAQRAADDAFARILEAARRGPPTAVIAMSDHGQVTISGRFDIEAALRADGFKAAKTPQAADRVALTLGAAGEVRVLQGDNALRRDLAAWAMGRSEIGMLFARDDLCARMDGVLPLSAAHLNHPHAADFFYVMAGDALPNAHGAPGRTLVTGGPPTGGGTHGGLSRIEMNTTLMIAAPGAAVGAADARACGLIDIAPTILSLLGLPCDGMDGAPLPLDAGPSHDEAETLTARCGAFAQRLERRGAAGRMLLHAGGRG